MESEGTMPLDTNDDAIHWIHWLLDAAAERDLHVKNPAWEELPDEFKVPFAKVLKSRDIPEESVDSCALAHIGAHSDPEIAAIFVWTIDEDAPENFLILVADDEGILGEYEATSGDDWPRYEIMARGRPYLIPIVQQILADGKPRTAEEILEIGIAKGLLPKTTLRKNLYGHLVQYIERTKAHGRKPLIIQNPTDRTFAINQPPDDWPDIPIPEPSAPSPQVKEVIDRLTATST